METPAWLAVHWFDALEAIGIVGGLFATAYTTHKDEKARKIGNMIEVNKQYHQIWHEFHSHRELWRVMKPNLDLEAEPITLGESQFVTEIILHLAMVFRMMSEKTLIPIEGLKRDVATFFTLPIPRRTWQQNNKFQNRDFVRFVESCLGMQ